LPSERVDLVEAQAHARDPRRLAGSPVPIGRQDEGAVGKRFDARIRAVRSHVVVHEPDPILPLATERDVLVGADPSDPVAPRRTALGVIAKRDEEPAVGSVTRGVTIARERWRKLARLRPGLALVLREHDEGLVAAAVLAK